MCLTKYVIDAEHANAYTMFKRLGRPAEITDEQAEYVIDNFVKILKEYL